MSYAELNPRVEPRLQEIYRKFAVKLSEFEADLADNFNVKGKFDPEQAREDIARRKERKAMLESLEMKVKVEIDRVYANKALKERKSLVFTTKRRASDSQINTLRQMNGDLQGVFIEPGSSLATLEPPDQSTPPVVGLPENSLTRTNSANV